MNNKILNRIKEDFIYLKRPQTSINERFIKYLINYLIDTEEKYGSKVDEEYIENSVYEVLYFIKEIEDEIFIIEDILSTGLTDKVFIKHSLERLTKLTNLYLPDIFEVDDILKDKGEVLNNILYEVYYNGSDIIDDTTMIEHLDWI